MMRPKDWMDREVAIAQVGDSRYYVRDGQRIASVTTMIGRVYPHLFADVPARALEYARARGQEVHTAIALNSGAVPRHTLDWDSLDAEVRPRVEMITDWLKEKEWRPIYVERAFFSFVYGVAGTPDQVGYFDARSKDEDARVLSSEPLTILDFKPEVSATADIQLAGYALCVRESLDLPYAPRRMSLNASKDRVTPIEYEDHGRNKAEFLGVLNAYRFGSRKGFWKDGQ